MVLLLVTHILCYYNNRTLCHPHIRMLLLISYLMTGTPLHRLVPIHSTRAGWDSLIHGQATRDIMMMTEYQLAGSNCCMHVYPMHENMCIYRFCILE